MVYNTAGHSEWVAFDAEQNACVAIETHSKGGKSAPRRKGDATSVTTWMKQPINSDSSWAPMSPPPLNAPAIGPPTRDNRRPPRARASSLTLENSPSVHQRQTYGGSNPASSDSSDSSAHRPSRGRSVQRKSSKSSNRSQSKTKDSNRGRTRSLSVSRVVDTAPTIQKPGNRGRSSSRKRVTTKDRDQSNSSKRRSRAGSRPPTTSSNRRSRSTSRTPVTTTRIRSTSRAQPRRPSSRPPSTSRTRQIRAVPGSSSSVGAGFPPRPKSTSNRSNTSDDDHSSLRSAPASGFRSPSDSNIGRDVSFGRTQPTRARFTTKPRSAFMEKIFGDQVTEEARQGYLPRLEYSAAASASSIISWQQPERIHSRILLTATVYHNTATNLWIATINTNQKGVAKNPATASKYLKAFSFFSEKEARESAIANAPPKMMPFTEHRNCFVCNGKFAMLRRAGHCRNCGVCVCNSCSTTWPSKMIPATYNLKKESQVKVCKSCNHLSSSFKKALLDGDYEEAIALYGSGNVNLRTPFPQFTKKDEVVYPIHCAVEGGNIDIVRWLMEDHFCPIKVIGLGSSKKPKRGGSADIPILTSKSRSVLSIAMGRLHVDILRYLVVDNGVSIYESKDLKESLRALETVLLALPSKKGGKRGDEVVPRWDDSCFDGDSVSSSLGADQTQVDETATLGSQKRNADSVRMRSFMQ